ncbi:uncharacterized protein C8Q71DRAFT_35474 [Rhodofomes roseus]|uniref:Secreted protein n=1 Tax=Rhodofomes roseus TaxID=34475 RepID=A0ABQ8KZY4_9APHY|nr:uncharacterized protein C8Q71DRAFT_35474 [Rhodofomes roseus]KAH9844221.1 hypothetical protein C8Q71DRAFT_35474 [Rhodofomes roseus]
MWKTIAFRAPSNPCLVVLLYFFAPLEPLQNSRDRSLTVFLHIVCVAQIFRGTPLSRNNSYLVPTSRPPLLPFQANIPVLNSTSVHALILRSQFGRNCSAQGLARWSSGMSAAHRSCTRSGNITHGNVPDESRGTPHRLGPGLCQLQIKVDATLAAR